MQLPMKPACLVWSYVQPVYYNLFKSLQIKTGYHSKKIMEQWWKRLCCDEGMNGK